MNLINYDKEMQNIIEREKSLGHKPKLLLHACCAPCSSTAIERLREYFDIAVFYYNPNIDTEEEYTKRLNEEIKFCSAFNIKVIDIGFNSEKFYSAVKGREKDPERGARCFICYRLRLNETARKAKEEGYDYFATTLTISPLKDADALNKIGYEEAEKFGVKYLPSDFKKKGGYLRSIELSKEYGLYRQAYCGCVFSKTVK